MSSPVDAGRATYAAAATQSHPITMPASIAADDLLVLFFRLPRNVTTSMPAGWSKIVTSQADADDDQQEIWLKTATGSEGSTQTLTLVETSRRCAAITYRITGAGSYVLSSDAISTTAMDSPNVSWTGTRDILALSLCGGSNALTLTSGPSGYSNAVSAITPGNTTDGTSCTVFGATKQISAVTSEDPPAYSFTGSVFATISWTLVLTDVSLNPYRVTQVPVDTAYSGAPAARVTSESVDVGYKGAPNFRLTQLPVDAAFHETFPKLRVTQEPIDVARKIDGKLRVTQMPVEVAISNIREEVDIDLIW
jgi:hypothetical protein